MTPASWAVAAALVATLLSACSEGDGGGKQAVEVASRSAIEPPTEAAGLDTALQAELLAMLERDQDERTGIGSDETDEQRTARLKEIIAEHGWPGYDLVGKEGEDAAWAIAQHSDLDPAFQAEALELLRAAVAAGQASPGNLAYLQDRVDVGAGRPQTYGTQVGCGPNGPRPATPVEDRDSLDARRAEVGLGTFDDYLTEMSEVCAGG